MGAPRPGRGVAGRKERDWSLAKLAAQVSRWSGRHMPLAALSGAQRCVAHWLLPAAEARWSSKPGHDDILPVQI